MTPEDNALDLSGDSLVASESALRQAQLTSDVATLERLIDDTLVFTGPDGLVYGKQDDLEAHRQGLIRITRLEPSEERIQRFGSIAVVSVRMEMSGTFKGDSFAGPFRYTRVWCARPDGWRIVAGHVSAVMNPVPAGDAPPADGEVEDQRTIRERVIRLAFDGDVAHFEEFVRVLSDATPAGVEVILRGSSVTGHKWGSDEPFDAKGPGTSDLDVTFVGGGMVSLFREFHIPEIHSVPLSEAHPFASPALGALRKQLCAMAKRPVNLQATTSLVQYLRDVVMDQPYLVLLKKADDEREKSQPVRVE